MLNRRLHSQNGFSLVEILVGLVLMGLVATAGFKLLDSTSRSETQNRAQNAQADQLRAAMAGIRADLSQANAITSVTPSLGSIEGAASGLTFRRVETSGSSKTCVTQRYELTGTTIKSITLRKADCDPDTAGDYPELQENADNTRIIVDNVTGLCRESCSNGQKPFLRFYVDAVTAADTLASPTQANALTSWLGDVGLVEVNLSRDGDGADGLLRASSLSSTVYLTNLASRTSGSTDELCTID